MSSPPKAARRRNRTGGGSAKARRSAARLAAVQALYQIGLAGAEPGTVLAEFVKHRLGHEVDGISYVAADPALFSSIVRGTSVRLADVDGMLSAALDPRMPYERTELLLKSILRAGAWELLANPETAARIVLTEYVEVANAFYQGREPGMVNGLLDTLARRLRPDEIGGPEPGPDSSPDAGPDSGDDAPPAA